MFILTNKELRHLKAMFNMAISAYEYDFDYCINGPRRKEGGCPRCKKMKAVSNYAKALKPNG